MRFWFRITELYGLWPKKTGKVHNAIAYIWFYCYITIYAILKLSLIPGTTKIEEFVEIFIYLPGFLLLAIKFTKFIVASDKLGKLLEGMKDLNNELNVNALSNFKSYPLIFKMNVAQYAILPFVFVMDSIKMAMSRSVMVKFWIPESLKDDEMTYWLYYAFERSSFSVVLLIFTFDIIIFAIIINLTRLAKAYRAKLRDLDLLRSDSWKQNVKDVVRIDEKLKRFVAEMCALNNSFIWKLQHLCLV